jgi:hypothetical protein
MLRKHHVHLELPKVKVTTIKLFHDFQKLHLESDILLNTNAKTNTLCLSIQMNCKWENFNLKNLLMFEDLTSNLSHSITIVTKQNLYKKTFKHLKTFLHKLETSFETSNNGKKISLTHLKLEDFNKLKNSLPHTSNFNVETLNNS